jgi:hypothetical protein
MNVNFVAATLISNNDLNEAWKAAERAAVACNTFTQERAVARSNARAEAMRVAHVALAGMGLQLPSWTRTQAEIYTDFKAKWGEDQFNGFAWGVAEAAVRELEVYRLEQEAWDCGRSGHRYLGADHPCQECGEV